MDKRKVIEWHPAFAGSYNESELGRNKGGQSKYV